MARMLAPVALRADRHYESLRDAVWLRVVADDPQMPWAAFEDAYQDAWEWIAGQTDEVVAESGSAVAYLTSAVRNRYVDELRRRSRGLGRGSGVPVLELLDDHAERLPAAGGDDLDDAREARRAISSIFLLARERLTPREFQAFALSYLLEMKPREAAQAMGVSAKRFRNLRWDGWRKVGDEVLELLEGRLQWCGSDEAARLRSRAMAGDDEAASALRMHVDVCAACSHSVAEARRAAAVLIPLPLVIAGRSDGFLTALVERVAGTVARAGDVTTAFPGGLRGAGAALAVAVAAGSGAAVTLPDREPPRRAIVAPVAQPAVAPARRAVVVPAPDEVRERERPARSARVDRRSRAPRAQRDPPASPASQAPPAAPTRAAPVAPAEEPVAEFGFE